MICFDTFNDKKRLAVLFPSWGDLFRNPIGKLTFFEVEVRADNHESFAVTRVFLIILFFFDLVKGVLCSFVKFEFEDESPVSSGGSSINPSFIGAGFCLNINIEQNEYSKEE